MAKKEQASLSTKQKEIFVFLEGLKKPSLCCQLNDEEFDLINDAQEHIKNNSIGFNQ